MTAAGKLAMTVLVVCTDSVRAQDWPQWRGPNRDGKTTGFTAPATWPKELTKKWSVKIGDGVATPALVGDKLYVFARQEGKEFVKCLSAADGKEIWSDGYEAAGASGPARGFAGPRASPAVADGCVVALGANGTLSCYDAASGKLTWRKDEYKGKVPSFFTSASPIIVDGLCIAELGSDRSGALVAYQLKDGQEKWKWTGDGAAYASPVLAKFGDVPVIVSETKGNIVAVGVNDGKLLWETPFAVRYNACTPMVDGSTIAFSGSGSGTKAVKIEKAGNAFEGKPLWSNGEVGVQFDTPVVHDGLFFGISDRDRLFCLDAATGKTAWSSELKRNRGYGSIVDAGSVMFALAPSGELIAFEPNAKEFKQLASYKVAAGDAYAYPVISGKRIFVKDKDAVTLWELE